MSKSGYKRIVKVVVTIVFILVVLDKIEINDLIDIMKDYSPAYLFFAFMVNLLVNLVGAFSLHAVYQKERVASIFAVTLKSNFYAMFLPGQILGETTKIFMLSAEHSTMGERVSAVVIDKFLNMVGMAFVGCMGIFLSPSLVHAKLKKYLLAGLVMMLLLLLAMKNSCLLHLIRKQMKRIVKNQRIVRKGENFLEAWLTYSNQDRQLIVSTFWGVIYQLLIAYGYYIVSLGFGLGVSFFDYCWMNTLLTIVLFLPVSIGGLGVREATLAGLLGMLGVQSEQAVAISLLLLFIQIMRAMLGGILVWMGKDS